jgi:hypothetical protein
LLAKQPSPCYFHSLWQLLPSHSFPCRRTQASRGWLLPAKQPIPYLLRMEAAFASATACWR